MARDNPNVGTIVVGGLKPHEGHMTGCRAIEIRISKSEAFLTLGADSFLMDVDGSLRSISGFQHLSIPPDLETHLTASDRDPSKRLFFEPPLTVRGSDRISLINKAALVFTYVSSPVALSPILTRFHRKLGAAIILIGPDDSYSATHTRCFVDFFALRRTRSAAELVRGAPLVLKSMRLPLDNHSVQGPFECCIPANGSKPGTNFFFFVRAGYCEFPGECIFRLESTTASGASRPPRPVTSDH